MVNNQTVNPTFLTGHIFILVSYLTFKKMINFIS